MKNLINLRKAGLSVFGVMTAIAVPSTAFAQDALDSGDTAWMLTSTALVLMMTIPGLALFYGGMVRKKNVLATLMQSFAVTCLMTVLWMVVGYSLAFADGGSMNAFCDPEIKTSMPSRRFDRPTRPM